MAILTARSAVVGKKCSGSAATRAQLIAVIRTRLELLMGEIATALKDLGFAGPFARLANVIRFMRVAFATYSKSTNSGVSP